MIFVSVGTHEQDFSRLIKTLDGLKGNGVIREDMLMQTGFSLYEPQNCRFKKIFCYDDFVRLVEQSRIFITHGGPGSIFLGLRSGKIPIVVPRYRSLGEHVDDHQVHFARYLESVNRVLAVYEIDKLAACVSQYDLLAERCSTEDRQADISSLVCKLEAFT
ncbi:MAG: hypothetical protein MJA29_02670 [Candidatus Omnitrophica bacterium]|nr:hypothetical protein [Candidatus Omnitrophota bacterium]